MPISTRLRSLCSVLISIASYSNVPTSNYGVKLYRYVTFNSLYNAHRPYVYFTGNLVVIFLLRVFMAELSVSNDCNGKSMACSVGNITPLFI